MMAQDEAMRRWGTWEELLLGSAVLRHGTRAWDDVASELRARTLFPCGFTPQECEAKYEDLQDRYSGCSEWFEELRRQRVAELKKELERSEDSIGSLQSKIESLMSEREGVNGSINCNAESILPTSNADGTEPEFPGKERSKDALSAGSFTEDTPREWSLKSEVPVADLANENTTTGVKVCEESDQEKACVQGSEVGRGNMKKRRGKRKRKGSSEVKEAASVGENEVLTPVNMVLKVKEESSTGGCDQNSGPSGAASAGSIREEETDLLGLLDSIMEPDYTMPFRRRLETQKRARYKKLIRRHLDFGTIRSRIEDGMIQSVKGLFRDVLLLCNNALVFYPKNSSKYKSALTIRDSVTKRFRRLLLSKDSAPPATAAPSPAPVPAPAPASAFGDFNLLLPKRNPVKPRSARPCNRKVAGKPVAAVGKVAEGVATGGDKEPDDEQPLAQCVVRKGVGRPAKAGSRGGRRRGENVGRGRKRARRR